MAKIILVPGHNETTLLAKYATIKKALTERGYEIIEYNPDWSAKKFSTWLGELVQIAQNEDDLSGFVGFSMGAMLSLVATSSIGPIDVLILCSPSGYLKEYVPLLTPEDVAWYTEQFPDVVSFSASDILAHCTARSGYVLVGDEELREWPDFKQWTADLTSTTGWPMTVIANTGHDIGADSYQKSIVELIGAL